MPKLERALATFILCGLCGSVVACSSPEDATSADGPPEELYADQVEIVRGVPDRGADPAVVALAIGHDGLCTGSLIAPDVVLTARHCVSQTSERIECPARGPQILSERPASSLVVLVGEDAATAVAMAHGKEVLTPPGATLCDRDIALIVLDRPIPEIEPLAVRKEAVVSGGRVRAVGFGKRGDQGPAGVKLVREHVRILEVTPSEFLVGEATCQGDSGGPAFDEATGEIVGVISRGGPACEGSRTHNVYTRVDAFGHLIEAALAKSAAQSASGTKKPARPKTTDMGAPCATGADCSAGVCAEEGGNRYCSRTCGSGDRCPAQFHCTKARGGGSYCAAH